MNATAQAHDNHAIERRPAETHADLTSRYCHIRQTTEALCAPLSPEDCQVQSMDDASPAKWHLAHTSWFFETFVLEQGSTNYRPFHPAFRVLFNSYYQSVGEQHPRPQRGLLSRPSLDEVLRYRAYVDEHMLALMRADATEALIGIVALGLQHEQQHQELILTDAKHLLSCNPLQPPYRQCRSTAECDAGPLRWHTYPGATYHIGHGGGAFAFDNEQPRHRVLLEPFELGSRLITNGEFLAFIAAGGYTRPELWLADGWNTVRTRGWSAPSYWERHDGTWSVMTLSGTRRLRADEPVCHVSFYEADAFARWAGARLPAEAEWEVAATDVAIGGNFVESDLLHPAPVASSTAGAFPAQLFGDVWEWTRSAYAPYPGYRPPEGPIGEYNGKFMCSQLVLRGGSCATPQSHVRPTYRNFFPPDARWQFSGIRLARDAQ